MDGTPTIDPPWRNRRIDRKSVPDKISISLVGFSPTFTSHLIVYAFAVKSFAGLKLYLSCSVFRFSIFSLSVTDIDFVSFIVA